MKKHQSKGVALIYTGQYKKIIVFIPKKKTSGFTTNAFGTTVQPNNKKEELLKKDIDIIDVEDVEDNVQYLSFGIKRTCNKTQIQKGIKSFKKAVQEVFPHIKSWRKITGEDFYELILN